MDGLMTSYIFNNYIPLIVSLVTSITLSVFVVILLVQITKFFRLKNKIMSKTLETKDMPSNSDNPQ